MPLKHLLFFREAFSIFRYSRPDVSVMLNYLAISCGHIRGWKSIASRPCNKGYSRVDMALGGRALESSAVSLLLWRFLSVDLPFAFRGVLSCTDLSDIGISNGRVGYWGRPSRHLLM